MQDIILYDINGEHVHSLTQWNNDITIIFDGAKTEPIPEVRYSNKKSINAICVSASVKDGRVLSKIPNELLQECLTISIQLVYRYDSGDTKTEYKVLIPVTSSVKPDCYVYEPSEVKSLDDIEKRVKKLEMAGVVSGMNERGYAATNLNDGGRMSKRSLVSFIDDDCRKESYEVLYKKVIEPLGVPYTVACPPGDIVESNISSPSDQYMSVANLMEMYNMGVGISCHHLHQYNMDDSAHFPTAKKYDEDLAACQELFDTWGIDCVKTVCYPQGRRIDEYIPIVKKHYFAGFTVGPGVNQSPYASYHMRRVGLFDSNEEDVDGSAAEASLENAKKYVNRVASEGGWLVFMTHAWYKGFNHEKLAELIEWIMDIDGVEIVGVNEALEATGNIIDIGNFKAPIDDMAEPYLVVSADGRMYTNALYNRTQSQNGETTDVTPGWHTGYILSTDTGKIVSKPERTEWRVSDPITVEPGQTYRLTCSAVYGFCAYSVLDADGNWKDKYPVPNTSDGEVLIDHEIIIPDGGVVLRVATDTTIQPDGYVVTRVEFPDDDSASVVSLGICDARVGQIAMITEVDGNGVPTAWKAVDVPNPVAKTEGMTQPVGMDADGRLWVEPICDSGADEIYIGGGEMPEGYVLQIDPEGDEAELAATQGWVTEQIRVAVTDAWEAVW